MRKPRVELSDSDWRKIQASYELDPQKPTLDQLAKAYSVHESTVCKRARAYSWHRRDSLAKQVIQSAEDQSRAIVEQTAATVANRLSAQIADSLEPWLAREKTKHVRSQIRRSKIALAQLDQHLGRQKPISPKDSSFIAKTANDWDNIARRNLGLSDGSVPNGSLQLNILTNHSAVQITPRKEP